MKSFVTFLNESGPLYHGTSFDNIHKILKKGSIDPSDEHGHTSMSRDKHMIHKSYGSEAYFQFDKDKIRHNQKVVPTDWHMGGSVKDKSARHDDNMRDSSFRRSESEELVKGKASLKHATHLVVNKKHWDHFHRPEDEHEKHAAHEMKNDPDGAWMYQGLTYKDRKKEIDDFHKHLKKHPHIKLVVKDY